MKKRFLPILIFAVLLTSCAPILPPQQGVPPNPQAPTDPPVVANPTDTPPSEPQEQSPTATPTPSPTLDEQVVVLTYEPPNIVMTAMALQIEDNQAKLTQSADQIATLMAESSALETRVASNATQVSATQAVSKPGGGNQGSSSGKYDIPDDVVTVVMVDKTTVFVGNKTNKQGVPIMEPYKPRVYLPAGMEAWVYETPIVTDGGTVYYESYDPDGETPDFKIYFKASHIQLRIPGGKPNPLNYPANVAVAEFIDDYALHSPHGYDKAGKPVMDTIKPLIKYKTGDKIIVYPKWVVATGGTLYVAVYDPDGEPSAFVRLNKLRFPRYFE